MAIQICLDGYNTAVRGRYWQQEIAGTSVGRSPHGAGCCRVSHKGERSRQDRIRRSLMRSATNRCLEVYFIDVGQGDGVLIRTPDNRHIMLDGGFDRTKQPTGKNAADFVDWKFAKDYGLNQIHLDAMIASHNDADHYGGLSDLLDTSQSTELDADEVRVDAFYHAGVGWWVNPATHKRWLGPTTDDKKFLTQLMGKRPQVVAALKSDAEPKLQGEWADFMKNVTQGKNHRRDCNSDPAG